MMNFILNKEIKNTLKNREIAIVGNRIAIEGSSISVFPESTQEKLYFTDYNKHLTNLIQLLPDCEMTILKRVDSNKMQDDNNMHTVKICVIVKKGNKIIYEGLLYQNTVDKNVDPYAF